MHRSPLILGLAAVFAGLTALLTIGAVVSGQPIALFVAAPLGLTSYFMYYHGSGQLARAIRHQRHARRRRSDSGDRGGFGAGPRTRRGPRTRAERTARARSRFGTGDRTAGAGGRAPPSSSGPTRSQARSVLGVSADAGQADIRSAYREKVKEVHPDRGGDEAEFKRVTAAYDRLSE
ncbi:J domain-containing protein [Natrononativus amylolyticus]|uniref:J domain-containing protein n=1 Tax=Natrononativus amylolyticus TaxID=2963434 RepID=UPI0020CB7E06|nr:J domain-containing protein [Natrononativus amylolyticus]